MRLYTRAVMRESQRSAGARDTAAVVERSARSFADATAPLDIHVETLDQQVLAAPHSPTFQHAKRAFPRAAWCYVVAGVVHAAVSTALLFHFGFYARPATP